MADFKMAHTEVVSEVKFFFFLNYYSLLNSEQISKSKQIRAKAFVFDSFKDFTKQEADLVQQGNCDNCDNLLQ